ncbi:hypothetical protein WD019_07380 [Fictibacillus sp. Mic-4]|uniref:hypothetical protein n=1 Tax=Fictibacillus TaxID=1329200 RepID=UPI00041FC69A|nr:hypothetical protein [Fictibacillus gelatini]
MDEIKKRTRNLQTNTPTKEEITISSNIHSQQPYDSDDFYPGDSVNEYKKIERVNEFLNEAEISQQNNNL